MVLLLHCILCIQVHEFFDFVGESSFYGAQKGESVESLALSILPSPDFKFTKLEQEAGTTTLQLAEAVIEEQEAENGPVVLLTALINTLQKDARFNFIKVGKEPAILAAHGCVYMYVLFICAVCCVIVYGFVQLFMLFHLSVHCVLSP